MTGRIQGPSAPRVPLGESPSFALLAAFTVFILFKWDMGMPFALAAALALASAAGWMCLGTVYAAESSGSVAAALLAAAVLGVFMINAGMTPEAARAPSYGRQIDAVGVVLLERRMGYTETTLVRTKPGGIFARSKIYVLKHRGEFKPGDVVRFSGKTEGFKRADGPGKFDEFLYWSQRGAYASVKTDRAEAVGWEFGWPYVRRVISERVGLYLPRQVSGYMAAAWLGEKDKELSGLHSGAGTSHILAVSGFHIGMAAAICWFLTRRLKSRLYIMSAVIWFYALLSGASPSAVRAALMAQFVLLGRLFGESGGPFNGVCFAASLMLAYNPWVYWDVGWRMSVLSVMALSSLYSLDVGGGAKYVVSGPLIWLVTSVQAAWTFGAVPLSGLVINFFAVPFFGVALPLATLLSLPAVTLRAGGFLARPAEALFALWERFSNNMTFLIPWRADFSYPLFGVGVAVAVYLFATACGFPRTRAYFAVCAGAVYVLYIILTGAL